MNELKILIDLSAGTRLPHYEQEIFSDKELAGYYLHKLCEQCGWYDHDDSSPCMAYYYARFVMESCWPDAEHIIATGPCWACNYATTVMESRWPEAEPVIAASDYREWYNQNFGTSI